MGKPEFLSIEDKTLPEKKDLGRIDYALETTLKFVEDIVNNPGKTQVELKKQANLIVSKFNDLYENNFTLISNGTFRNEIGDGQNTLSAMFCGKQEDFITKSAANYYSNYKERKAFIELDRLGRKLVTTPDDPKIIRVSQWQQVWSQKYRINLKGDQDKFESFELFENKYTEKGISTVERMREIEVKVTYDWLDQVSKLEIIVESNPLNKEELFQGKPSAMKKKSLEIELV